MNIIESYLREKNLDFKEVNWQYNLKKSPISGEEKRNHFYISMETGMRDDKKTGKSGNFNQFRDMFNDAPVVLPEQHLVKKEREYKVLPFESVRQYQQNLRGLETDVQNYLKTERGFEERTLKHFKVGVDNGQITIPHFDSNDNLVNIRRRKNPKDTNEDMPKYYLTSGCKCILYNEVVLKKNPMEVIITEGEFDAMLLWQKGITNVMSISLGAGYFSEAWVDQFKGVKRIYLAYDADIAWSEWAMKAAEKLGKDRCRFIDLPRPPGEKKMDISDWFNKHGGTKEQFVDLMNKAKSAVAFDTDSVRHISDYNDELRLRVLAGDYKGISTGYEKLDSIIGWYRRGRVIILSGLTSTGKTTFSQNLSLSLAYRNIPIMYISMEMPPIDISKKFLMLHKKISGKTLETIEETSLLMETVDEWLKEFKGDAETPGLPIYLFNGTGEINIKSVLDVCRVAKEVYGTQLVVIDHLHYFAGNTDNRTAEVSKNMRAIKNMAMELDLPILLLAHLNRAGRAGQRKGLYIPSMADLRESGAIEQDADQVAFVCRDSESPDPIEKRKTIIKVAKNRDGATGYTSNDFDLDIGAITEVVGVDYLEQAESKMKDTSKQPAAKWIVQPANLPF